MNGTQATLLHPNDDDFAYLVAIGECATKSRHDLFEGPNTPRNKLWIGTSEGDLALFDYSESYLLRATKRPTAQDPSDRVVAIDYCDDRHPFWGTDDCKWCTEFGKPSQGCLRTLTPVLHIPTGAKWVACGDAIERNGVAIDARIGTRIGLRWSEDGRPAILCEGEISGQLFLWEDCVTKMHTTAVYCSDGTRIRFWYNLDGTRIRFWYNLDARRSIGGTVGLTGSRWAGWRDGDLLFTTGLAWVIGGDSADFINNDNE